MKKVLIGVMFGMFLFGAGIANTSSVQAEEHTKEYLEWEKKTTEYISLSRKCLKVNNDVRKIVRIIETQYNNPNQIAPLINYVEKLRQFFIITHRDIGDSGLSGTKLSGIPNVVATDETTTWFNSELLKALEPLDDISSYTKTKIEAEKIASTKLESLKFLHVVVKNIQNGGDIRKAIQDADAFEKDINFQQ